jgi:HEAT repeat protein
MVVRRTRFNNRDEEGAGRGPVHAFSPQSFPSPSSDNTVEMLDQLIQSLVRTRNEAADDLLLQALRMGIANEQRVALDVLVQRKTLRGLSGVLRAYPELPEPLQELIVSRIGLFHHALAECGRSNDSELRMAAIRLIAIGRQGKLAYVLSENLHSADPALSKTACEAMVALARWVATETKRLQQDAAEDAGTRGRGDAGRDEDDTEPKTGTGTVSEPKTGTGTVSGPSILPASPHPRVPASCYDRLLAERPEIEAAVARAMNVHRGKHGQDLLRAALLLADWSGSQTLAILHTPKHGGQSPMVRRLQQPPDAEHVAAFLLGATHGQVRSHFGAVFARIDQAPVLDALLRKTHWLKDAQLQGCVHQVTRGTWYGVSELRRDVERRGVVEAAQIADWIASGGLNDAEQDERLRALLEYAKPAASDPAGAALPESLAARLHLLRVAMRRRRGAAVELLRSLLTDPDERIVRMAAREIVRRRPPDFENILLKLMTSAPASVRRVIGRAIGQAGFDGYWQRFDRLDKSTRQQAGRAMLKLLPDGLQRLQRRALAGTVEQRVKAMQIIHELALAEPLVQTLIQLCTDANPRIRSKAVSVLGEVPAAASAVLMERLLNDPDARVRANVVEVLEHRGDPQFVPALAQRAHTAGGRERANAIKAMHRMKVGTAGAQLLQMLRDERPDHRISALWALRQIGWWQLINEVGQLAKSDGNVRVRRYALGVLKNVAEMIKDRKKAAG